MDVHYVAVILVITFLSLLFGFSMCKSMRRLKLIYCYKHNISLGKHSWFTLYTQPDIAYHFLTPSIKCPGNENISRPPRWSLQTRARIELLFANVLNLTESPLICFDRFCLKSNKAIQSYNTCIDPSCVVITNMSEVIGKIDRFYERRTHWNLVFKVCGDGNWMWSPPQVQLRFLTARLKDHNHL